MSKTNNVVAKNAHKFQRSIIFKDKKKAEKRGAHKHKGQWPALSRLFRTA